MRAFLAAVDWLLFFVVLVHVFVFYVLPLSLEKG